jgi:hypothetical protein
MRERREKKEKGEKSKEKEERKTKEEKAVFRIRDILGRIRIRGSVSLNNGFGSSSGSCSFRQ